MSSDPKAKLARELAESIGNRLSVENIIAIVSTLLLGLVALAFDSLIRKGKDVEIMYLIVAGGFGVVWVVALQDRRLNRRERADIANKDVREGTRNDLLGQFADEIRNQVNLERPSTQLDKIVSIMNNALDDTPLGTRLVDQLLGQVEVLSHRYEDMKVQFEEIKSASESSKDEGTIPPTDH